MVPLLQQVNTETQPCNYVVFGILCIILMGIILFVVIYNV